VQWLQNSSPLLVLWPVAWADLLPAKLSSFNYFLKLRVAAYQVSLAKVLLIHTFTSGSPAEIPIATANKPGMPSKLTNKVRLGIYRTQIRPREQDFVAISGLRISRQHTQLLIG